ncbi:MAG TPA: dockerin type I domain-containing protein [Chthonomonadaceae bacterium]|nr:dockerin type I domain-containing protein [Chthonomonadaceae bacterium]
MSKLLFVRSVCRSVAAGILLCAAWPLSAQTRPVAPEAARPAGLSAANVDMHSVSALERLLKGHWAKAHSDKASRKRVEGEQDRDRERAAGGARFRPIIKGKHQEEEETQGLWLPARLFFMKQRAFPFDRVDYEAYSRARLQRDHMPAANLQGLFRHGPGAAPLSGPRMQLNQVGPRWESLGPGGYDFGVLSWRVNGMGFDRTNPNTLYVAAPSGGIWKTTDGGNSWRPLTDAMPGLAASCVSVSPTNHNLVLAGTGDYDGGNGPGFGVLRSTDGGATWTIINIGSGSEAIHRITFDPRTPSKIFATGGRKGLFRSIDSGRTWQMVIGPTATPTAPAVNGSFSNVVYNSSGETIYASADGAGIYQSTNGGTTWIQAPGAPTGSGRFDVACSTIRTLRGRKTVYVLNGGGESVSKGEPPADDDRGTIQWKALDGFPKTPKFIVRPYWDQKGYNFYLAVTRQVVNDPGDPTANPPIPASNGFKDIVYVGMVDLWQSQDGGILWQGVPTYHVDHHMMFVSPFDPNLVYDGNDGGVYRVSYTPGTEPRPTPMIPNPPMNPPPVPAAGQPRYGTFNFIQPLNRGLGIAQFYTAAYAANNPNLMVGGTQDNGNVAPLLGFDNWFNVNGGDGGGCGINPEDGNIQYTSNFTPKLLDPQAEPIYEVYHTTDAWNSQENIDLDVGDDTKPFILAGGIHQGNPHLFLLATNHLYRFDDTIGDWIQYDFQFSDQGYVLTIATTPLNPNYLYVGTTDGTLYFSADGGDSFSEIGNAGAPGGLPLRSITKIVVSPNDPNRIFVTVSGTGTPHIWRCDDTTAFAPIWRDISGTGGSSPLPDIFTNTLAVLPDTDDSVLFVGTDVGVFQSANGGQTWSNATATLGLPNVIVNDLTYVPGTGYLQAATFGRGFWRLQLRTSENTPAQFTVQFHCRDWVGDDTQLPIKVELQQGGISVVTKNGTLARDGTFGFTVPNAGVYDVYVTIPRFLRKKFADLNITDGTVASAEFIDGDVNGDNVINRTDLYAIAFRLFGPGFGNPAPGLLDVDGDGYVTFRDLNIVATNQGKSGD